MNREVFTVVIDVPEDKASSRVVEKIKNDLREVAKTWNRSGDVRVTVR